MKPHIVPNPCLYLYPLSAAQVNMLKTDFLAAWLWTESLCAGFLWDPRVLSHFKLGQYKPVFNRFVSEDTGKYLPRDEGIVV